MLAGCGYKTKKDLKGDIGKPLRYLETSLFGQEYKPNGEVYLVGPEAYVRKWFARVTMKDGLIVRVS